MARRRDTPEHIALRLFPAPWKPGRRLGWTTKSQIVGGVHCFNTLHLDRRCPNCHLVTRGWHYQHGVLTFVGFVDGAAGFLYVLPRLRQ